MTTQNIVSSPPSRRLMTLLTFTTALLSNFQYSASSSNLDQSFDNVPVSPSSLASSSLEEIQNENIERSQQNEDQQEGEQKLTWERCSTHEDCQSCTTSSWGCHWCSHDNACHAKGSIDGCSFGASCSDQHPPDSQICADHSTCADCAASSWGCHWCAFDEACHAVGSVHGCATGVNCYAIDRCQRLEPEKVEDGGIFSASSFTGAGPVVKVVLGIVVGLVLCCSTVCLVGASAVKCAVDDLVGEEDGVDYRGRMDAAGGNDDAEEEQDELEIALLRQPLNDGVTDNINVENGEEGENNNRNSNVNPRGDHVPSSQRSRISKSASTARRQPKGGSIRQIQPQYNVCTDQLAWKSIVEGMASLKMSASFDLLISVYNPNRFEVDLDNGSGQFHHDGEYVGSFTIPSAKISAKAISDMVVKVSFTPDKWAALSLTSEYYRGTLKFMVGGHTHVKIPGLGNYQFDAKFDDVLVNVNDPELDDTHLCACPGWKKPVEEEF
ncbi:hypothetical protein ACHAXS_008619 [Conticribra weissflogii]